MSGGPGSQRFLALETSSATGTVALAVGADVAERRIDTPREQTERLLPLVDELLSAAGLALPDLDAIVFGRGPGSFTGLRISAALAQGLALATGLPIVAVSSLRALAQRAFREYGVQRSLICVDARMKEAYSAAYVVRDGRAQLLGEERLGAPASVQQAVQVFGATPARNAAVGEDAAAPAAGPIPRGWSAVGDGWAAYCDELEHLQAAADEVLTKLVPTARDLLPQAAVEYAAGNTLAAHAALPVYLRNESAWRRSSS